MNRRLYDIVQYKTGGRQSEFAALMDWTPQYLTKLLKGSNFGIAPIITILKKFKEIDARWLILGEGTMIDTGKMKGLHESISTNFLQLIELETLMPVMSPSQLRRFENIALGLKLSDFTPEEIVELRNLKEEKDNEIEARFSAAITKATTICKQ